MSSSASRLLVLLLAVVGLVAAGTSTYVHYQLLTVPNFSSFCDVNSTVSCTQAYLSSYGELGGVPVAILGALYFAVVLAIAALGWRPDTKVPSFAPAYIFLFSLPALAFVGYLAFASFAILKAFCILCVSTYVAVIGIAIVTWQASKVPLGSVPARASGDLAAAARNPVALAVLAVLVVATVVAARAFPEGGAPPAPVAVEALPIVAEAERAKLVEWWDIQPKENVPIDGGGAKVVVVKFNDYQCPLCGVTYNAYKPVFDKYPGTVKAITKHYPLESECNPGVPGGNHLAACEAAAAVLMAEAKGTSDKMEAWLFSHQGPPILSPQQVRDAARDVAGVADFEAQYQNVLKRVREDAILGEQLKVNATPTFFINGRRLPQALAAQYINVIIEHELKRP